MRLSGCGTRTLARAADHRTRGFIGCPWSDCRALGVPECSDCVACRPLARVRRCDRLPPGARRRSRSERSARDAGCPVSDGCVAVGNRRACSCRM